jgi:hypothetical protein
MGVGKVGGGGRKGGPKGAGGTGGAGKVGGAGFAGKVDRTEAVEGVSGAVGPSGASGVAAVDPVTSHAIDIARQLRSGQIKTKEEATKKLVAEVLKEKVRMQSKALTEKIADTIQDDPRLKQALERLWTKAE